MWEDPIKMENKWENIDKFKDYEASLSELDDVDKLQQKNLAHFIRCVKDATLKCFRMWTRELLLLSILPKTVYIKISCTNYHVPSNSGDARIQLQVPHQRNC